MKKLDVLTRVITILCAILMVVITGTTFIQVVRRYMFGSVFRWAEELAIYAMVWVTFLGAVLCQRHSEHVRIDFFINLLPAKLKKWVEVFDLVICMVFMMILAFYSPSLLGTTGKFISTGFTIPMYFVYGSVLVSAILMIPYFIVQIIHKVKGIEEAEDENATTPKGENV